MATTGIWPVKSNLFALIKYTEIRQILRQITLRRSMMFLTMTGTETRPSRGCMSPASTVYPRRRMRE